MDSYDWYDEKVQVQEHTCLLDEDSSHVPTYDEMLRLLESSIPNGYALNLDSVVCDNVENGRRIRGVYFKVESC